MSYRVIQICLDQKNLYYQLRALFCAFAYGCLTIMFPMITFVQEVLDIKEIIRQGKADPIVENISFAEDIRLEIMIETPESY